MQIGYFCKQTFATVSAYFNNSIIRFMNILCRSSKYVQHFDTTVVRPLKKTIWSSRRCPGFTWSFSKSVAYSELSFQDQVCKVSKFCF